MARAAQVGDPPNIVKGELIKRGYSYVRIARDLEVQPNTIWMVIQRRTRSRRVEQHLNEILATPV